jgi:hypothetical protein
LVEQRIENPRVDGSIPPLATIQWFYSIPRSSKTLIKPAPNIGLRVFLCP